MNIQARRHGKTVIHCLIDLYYFTAKQNFTIQLVGMPTGAGMWTAIVVAGLLFGLGHLPGAVAAGVKITRRIVVTALVLNMVVAVSCGWLFWRHGLLAAIVAHALVHAVWHPLERRPTELGEEHAT